MDKKFIKIYKNVLWFIGFMNLLLLISNFVIISFMVRVQVLMDTIVAIKIERVMVFWR